MIMVQTVSISHSRDTSVVWFDFDPTLVVGTGQGPCMDGPVLPSYSCWIGAAVLLEFLGLWALLHLAHITPRIQAVLRGEVGRRQNQVDINRSCPKQIQSVHSNLVILDYSFRSKRNKRLDIICGTLWSLSFLSSCIVIITS